MGGESFRTIISSSVPAPDEVFVLAMLVICVCVYVCAGQSEWQMLRGKEWRVSDGKLKIRFSDRLRMDQATRPVSLRE